MTFQAETYVDPKNGDTYNIGLISIYPDPGRVNTIVVASTPYAHAEDWVGGGDIAQVLMHLINRGLITDEQAQACVKYHGLL